MCKMLHEISRELLNWKEIRKVKWENNKVEVKEFLEKDSLKFDFSDDCDYTKDSSYKSMSGFTKYFAYKTLDNVKDPDSNSTLLQEIYKVLWPELEQKDYMRGKGWIHSDTMTSVQHTLAKYFEATFPNEVKEYLLNNPRQRFVSVRMCKSMYEQFSTVSSYLDSNADLKQFVSLYHTLGNYSPVPTGFNVARSGVGYSSNYDYWDLTLMKIKKYFDLRKKTFLKRADDVNQIAILFHYEETINNCMKWLDGYDSWNDFVEQYFFQDYVDDEGEVIPFCTGHSWKDGCNEVGDYDEFFKNAWNRIEARSNRMISALKKKLEKN